MPYGPVYQTALYGASPPAHVPVIVIDWPLSIVGVVGFIEEIDRGDGGKAYAFAIANVSIIRAKIIGNVLNLAGFMDLYVQTSFLDITTIVFFGIIL